MLPTQLIPLLSILDDQDVLSSSPLATTTRVACVSLSDEVVPAVSLYDRAQVSVTLIDESC